MKSKWSCCVENVKWRIFLKCNDSTNKQIISLYGRCAVGWNEGLTRPFAYEQWTYLQFAILRSISEREKWNDSYSVVHFTHMHKHLCSFRFSTTHVLMTSGTVHWGEMENIRIPSCIDNEIKIHYDAVFWLVFSGIVNCVFHRRL